MYRITGGLSFVDPNFPPVIQSGELPKFGIKRRWSHQVQAYDVDPEDTLNYTLIGGPMGMAINSSSGWLSWIPGDVTSLIFPSNHSIVVVVKDGLHNTYKTFVTFFDADGMINHMISL